MVDSVDVGAIHSHVVVVTETLHVRRERLGSSTSDVIITVVESLQQARIEVVKTVLVDTAADECQ